MAPLIIALIVLILFILFLGYLFIPLLLQMAVNLLILGALYLRTKVEILKEKKGIYYLIGLALTLILFGFISSFFEKTFIWVITWYFLISFTITQLIMFMDIKLKLIKYR